MVLIAVTAKYPVSKAKELADVYVKGIKENPLDRKLLKPVLMTAARATLEGIEVLTIYQVKGKYEEALKYMGKRMIKYGQVEGYQYSIVTWAEAAEAFYMLDMTAPEV